MRNLRNRTATAAALCGFKKVEAPTLELSGCKPFTLGPGSVWALREGSDYTELTLQAPGKVLDGLTVSWDWSQFGARPETRAARVRSLLSDKTLLEQLVTEHLRADGLIA